MTELLPITRDDLITSCDGMGVYLGEDERDSITTTYSGRFMYGEECFGVTVDASSMLLLGAALLDALVMADYDDPAWVLGQARTDNMGLQTIVYFPGLNLTPEDDETDIYNAERAAATTTSSSTTEN